MKNWIIKVVVNFAIKFLKDWVEKSKNKENATSFKKVVAGLHEDENIPFEIEENEKSYYLD